MSEKHIRELLQKLSNEHDVLRKQIADLRQFWSEVSELGQRPKYEEMGYRVQQLRDALAAHFSSEEEGGYLAPVLEVIPRLSPSATQLELEHMQFLNPS
jgi:hypothetical protein